MDLVLAILYFGFWFGLTALYMYIYFSIFKVYFIGNPFEGMLKIFLGCLFAAFGTMALIGNLIIKYWLYIVIIVLIVLIGLVVKEFLTD